MIVNFEPLVPPASPGASRLAPIAEAKGLTRLPSDLQPRTMPDQLFTNVSSATIKETSTMDLSSKNAGGASVDMMWSGSTCVMYSTDGQLVVVDRVVLSCVVWGRGGGAPRESMLLQPVI